MLNKVKHLYTDSSLTLRMTGSVDMYIITKGKWILLNNGKFTSALSSWLAYSPTAVPFTLATEYKTGELVLVKNGVEMFTKTLDLRLFLTV